ncbi:MAG: beta-ketoacyl-ACP synthase [Gammaproteobacteria bacterium]|jgi:3-oxoacyl-[acyl-carrier-protein] synthase-1|nr:beta-ketoacyl-ACP synthase [Gammaproteobacteria bacterium]
MMPADALLISASTLVNALGRGSRACFDALEAAQGGLRRCDFDDADLDTWIGRVDGLEDEPVVDELAGFDCRNNRLAQLGLRQDDFVERVAQARDRYGAARIGVFIGTSTSGVLQAELAYRHRDPVSGALPADFSYFGTQNVMSVAEFTRRFLSLQGPVMSVSTACSSSAKVFASAYRHIKAGLCDAAVVGGADSLCFSTLYGFSSLGLVSDRPCRPWDAERHGMNIGEGAGFALLEKMVDGAVGVALLGYGESSDAYHMSSPHPEGAGAAAAMKTALERAGLTADAIDYINLHGTGTWANDESEDRAVMQVFGSGTTCSATKGFTGHTLGAAGITETLFALGSIERGFIPGTLNSQRLDPELSAAVLLENRAVPVTRVLSNSFGFGGSNCSLVLGAVS